MKKVSAVGFVCVWLAAVGGVGAATYSRSIAPGYNFVANPLDHAGGNTIQNLFPVVPDQTFLYKYNNQLEAYEPLELYDISFGWLPGTTVLNPGDGAILYSPTNATLSITGTTHVPVLPLNLRGGFFLLSRQTNAAGNFTNILGFNPSPCGTTMVFRFIPGVGHDPGVFSPPNYTVYTFSSNVWSPSAPVLNVGECAWFKLPGLRLRSQPVTRRVSEGGTATFSVDAVGDGPLTYQWFRGSNALDVFSRPTFTIYNAQVTDVDNYWVRISDACSSTNSSIVSLIFTNNVSTLNLPPGFSTIANHFYRANGDYSVAALIPNPGVPVTVYEYKFPPPPGRYDMSYFDPADGIWSDPTMTLKPGEGAFINVGGPSLALTFSGEVRPSTNSPLACAVPGYRLVSSPVPQPARYEDLTGVPPCDGAAVHIFDPAIHNYRAHFFLRGTWSDGEPIVPASQSAFISYQPPVANGGPMSPDPRKDMGTNITFADSLSGGSEILLAQWRRNGIDIPGETNATTSSSSIAISNAQCFTNFGIYALATQTRRVLIDASTTPATTNIADVPDAVFGAPHVLKFSLPVAPLMDDFGLAATNIASFTGTVNNANATVQPGEPSHAGKPGGHSMWLTWNAPASGVVTFRTIGSSFDTLLAAYTGNSVSALTEVASDDDGAGYSTSLMTFYAQAGTAYRIAVDGRAGATGDIVLNWEFSATASPVPRFLSAPASQSVFPGSAVTLTATLDRAPAANTVFWYLNGTRLANGAAGITLSNLNQTNLFLSITSAEPAHVGVYWVQLSNVIGAVTAVVQSASAVLELGTQAGILSQDKLEDLELESAPDAKSAKAISSVAAGTIYSQTLNNLLATLQRCESNNLVLLGGSSRWLKMRVAISGTMTIDTFGSTNDTVLGVFTGTNLCDLSGLDTVARDDDSGPNGKTSRLAFLTVPGTDYYVAVDVKPRQQGNITLHWNLFSQPRFGDTNILTAPPTNQASNFQWQRDGTNLSGQNWYTYTQANFQPSDAGRYSVVVSNRLGRVTNDIAFLNPVELRVMPNVPIASLQTNFQFSVTGRPGNSFKLEYATNLGPNAVWRSVLTNTFGPSGTVIAGDRNAEQYRTRVYRATPK